MTAKDELLPLSFTSVAKYHIKDRGDVYEVINPQRYERDDCPYLGKDVLIDGKEYHVIGVESFCLSSIREGASIGLLVRTDNAQG